MSEAIPKMSSFRPPLQISLGIARACLPVCVLAVAAGCSSNPATEEDVDNDLIGRADEVLVAWCDLLVSCGTFQSSDVCQQGETMVLEQEDDVCKTAHLRHNECRTELTCMELELDTQGAIDDCNEERDAKQVHGCRP